MTIIMVHHDPKPPSQGAKGRASGSAALLNEPDTRIMVDRTVVDSRADNRISLEIRSRLQAPMGKVEAIFIGRRLKAVGGLG